MVDEVNSVLANIPELLQYFIPGFCAISIFNFAYSKKSDKSVTAIISCCVSYVFLTVIYFLRLKWKWLSVIPNDALGNSGLAIGFGVIFVILISWLIETKPGHWLIIKLFHKTPSDTLWRDVIDFKNGSSLKVYLRNKNYYICGSYKNQDEDTEKGWIAVSGFKKYNINDNEPVDGEPDFLNDNRVVYVVRFADIDHVEVFNDGPAMREKDEKKYPIYTENGSKKGNTNGVKTVEEIHRQMREQRSAREREKIGNEILKIN